MPAQSFLYDDEGPYLNKDPQATLDYVFDWSRWLAGDTIASKSVTVSDGSPPSATLATSSNTTSTVTAWVTGGTVGGTITVTAHITTASGRQDDRSFRLKVVER